MCPFAHPRVFDKAFLEPAPMHLETMEKAWYVRQAEAEVLAELSPRPLWPVTSFGGSNAASLLHTDCSPEEARWIAYEFPGRAHVVVEEVQKALAAQKNLADAASKSIEAKYAQAKLIESAALSSTAKQQPGKAPTKVAACEVFHRKKPNKSRAQAQKKS